MKQVDAVCVSEHDLPLSEACTLLSQSMCALSVSWTLPECCRAPDKAWSEPKVQEERFILLPFPSCGFADGNKGSLQTAGGCHCCCGEWMPTVGEGCALRAFPAQNVYLPGRILGVLLYGWHKEMQKYREHKTLLFYFWPQVAWVLFFQFCAWAVLAVWLPFPGTELSCSCQQLGRRYETRQRINYIFS